MASNGVVKIKKGFDINLAGSAAKEVEQLPVSELVALKPTDFLDLFPKLMVEPGDEVKAGDPIFYSKDREELKFTSPVSGEVVEVVRGAKRKMLEVRILADKDIKYKDFSDLTSRELTKDNVTEALMESGAWHFIRQRPYSIIADRSEEPKAIFISGFDTSPLAPDVHFTIKDNAKDFQKGIEVLQAYGVPVHLSLKSGGSNDVFENVSGVEKHYFDGPHPAGNVGVQVHHIDPIKDRSELIWYVAPQDVVIIGKLFNEGKYIPERIVPLTGSEVKSPKYYKALVGTALKGMLEGNLEEEGNKRIILGNALTGSKTSKDGFLGFYDTHITVLPEGDDMEFLGWLLPGFGKLSLSRTFFSWIMKKDEYVLDTNNNGEERNFVVTGEYDKVLPMNIYPVQLLKAIMARDFELMEQLGIYEVSEEDLALCEFVCTSKIPVQRIVAEGLEVMRKEG